MASDNLSIPFVSVSQNQKELTINNAVNALDDAGNSALAITITANRTLSAAEFTGNMVFVLSGTPASNFDLVIPTTKRFFAVRNSTGKTCTVKYASGSTLAIANGGNISIHSDGTTIVSMGGGGMTNPMTTSQDIIVGGSSGTPGRLAAGTNGFVLTMVAGAVAWAAATGMANPMTTLGDIILGGSSGTPGRLAIGSTGQVLTVVSGSPAWATPASGFANPMTTAGDIIYGGTSGTPTRLAAGSNTQVLTLAGGVPTWATPSSGGMTNPMTAVGDLIVGSTAGAAVRLGIGTTGQVLTVSGGTAAWAAASGGSSGGLAAACASGDLFPFYQGPGGYAQNTLNSSTRLHLNLFQLDSALTFTAMSIACRSTSVGSSMDIGIYEFLGAGKPGNCLASANFATTATGKVTVTLGSPVTLPAGIYYVAWHGTSTSPSIMTITQSSASCLGQFAGLAISDAMTQLGAGTTTLTEILFNDSSLPGGSYTRGMNLTGLTMSSGNIVGYNTYSPCVALTKQ